MPRCPDNRRPHPAVFPGLQALGRHQPLWLAVNGHCMSPRLRHGDRVAVLPAPWYWPGDVLALRAWDGRLLVHRLLGWRWRAGRLEWVTAADNGPGNDVPVGRDQILGRVLATRPARDLLPVAPRDRLRAVARLTRLAAGRLTARWT